MSADEYAERASDNKET